MARKKKDHVIKVQPSKSEPSRKASKPLRIAETPSAMINTVLVFIAILPFTFSRVTMDPVLSIRYTLIAGFVGLFILYFYLLRKTTINAPWPLLVKLAIGCGIAFGLWNFISMTVAVNKQQVYYGVSRHFLNMILLFVFTNMASKEETHLARICKALSIVALIHFIIGLGQFYGGAFTEIPGNFPPYGIMANRNLFGSAQVMLLPFVIFVLYKSSSPWKIIASLSLLGIAGSAIISQTRASWIATIVMVFLSATLVSIFFQAYRKRWLVGSLIGIASAVLLALLFINSDDEGVFSQSIKQRTSDMFVADSAGSSSAAGNVSERLKIWKKTAAVIRDNPFIGVGAGNWKITVSKYGSEGLLWAKGEYIPDSTHNDYLLVAAESGIPGAILYFSMWLLITWMGFTVIRKTQNNDRRVLAILLLSGLSGYAFDSMFSFPMERMEHGVYLYLGGGILIGMYLNELRTDKNIRKLPLVIVASMILIATFNLFLGFKKMNFEKYTIRSKSLEQQKSYQQAIIEGEKAKNAFVNIAPNGFPVEAYIGLAQKGLKKFPEALKEMDASIKWHPYNKALYVNKGTVYTDMGKYDSAIKYFEVARKLTPQMDIIYFNMAANYSAMKNYKAALETLKKADVRGYPDLIKMKQQLEALVDTTKNK